MNIHEFCERFHISLRKAREMDKARVLRLDSTEGAELSDTIRGYLARGNPLTTLQLVELIENPRYIGDLGKYQQKARELVMDLGNAKSEAAPPEISGCLFEASKGDPEEIERLALWLFDIIPAREVPHAYIAVRLLLGTPEISRPTYARIIALALQNVRKLPSFANWSRIDKSGHRRATFYKRPAKITLDL